MVIIQKYLYKKINKVAKENNENNIVIRIEKLSFFFYQKYIALYKSKVKNKERNLMYNTNQVDMLHIMMNYVEHAYFLFVVINVGLIEYHCVSDPN